MNRPPSIPSGSRLYAVGDIHGRLDLLMRLLAMIEEDAAHHTDKKKRIVFLGDYVDRGLDSKGVLDRLMKPMPSGLMPVFMRGNHDDMFRLFLAGRFEHVRSWLQLGGGATVASYGVNPFSARGGEKPAQLHAELLPRVPKDHIEFLRKTKLSASLGDYTFVHAGLRPNVPITRQTAQDKMWIRGDFLFSDDSFETLVVHGHTIRPEPEIKSNRIGIDTGAFATGRLTCLVLDGTEQKFIQT